MQYNHDNIRLGAKRNRKVSFLLLYNVQCFGVGGHLICKTATATSAQTARWPLDRSGRGTLINVDICRLTKHILHNGAMKARARKVYFKSRCEKLACETFKSLDSCAPTKKRGWIIRLAFDNRTDKEGKKGREGGELSFGQNRSQCSAAFSMETCF